MTSVSNSGTRIVVVDGEEPELTALEFDLLVALSESPGLVLSRRQLIDQVWGWDFVGDERGCRRPHSQSPEQTHR